MLTYQSDDVAAYELEVDLALAARVLPDGAIAAANAW
jgi:hypothetical protein